MKLAFLISFLFFFKSMITFGQSKDFLPATADSIFYSGGQHFKYKGLDYESARAFYKVLHLDKNSELYESLGKYTRIKRWMTALEIIGISGIGASVDNFGFTESEIYPVPMMVGLVSLGASVLLWKKSRRQLRNFVDDYNHAVYDRYIQQKFMSSNLNPHSQIKVGFTLKF